MHLGRAACLVPEHDDLHKRIERLKDAREKEKEKVAAIKNEYENKEQILLAELGRGHNMLLFYLYFIIRANFEL
jgi:hypothetical protein